MVIDCYGRWKEREKMRLREGQTLKSMGVPTDRVDPIDRMVRGGQGRVIKAAVKKNRKEAKKKQPSADTVLEQLNIEHQNEIARLNRQLESVTFDYQNYIKATEMLALVGNELNNEGIIAKDSLESALTPAQRVHQVFRKTHELERTISELEKSTTTLVEINLKLRGEIDRERLKGWFSRLLKLQ